jgi:quercetin dioxygenase-like cupin family protein
MGKQLVVRQPGEGTPLWMLGGLYEVKAASDETGGELTAMEMTLPAGAGPPPHVHSGAEVVYVLEGTIRYHIDGDVVEAGPGAFFYIPEGLVENFEPTSEARLLVLYAPGGMDRFFAEAGEPARSREIPPPSKEPPDLEAMTAIGARHGLDLRAPERA